MAPATVPLKSRLRSPSAACQNHSLESTLPWLTTQPLIAVEPFSTVTQPSSPDRGPSSKLPFTSRLPDLSGSGGWADLASEPFGACADLGSGPLFSAGGVFSAALAVAGFSVSPF